MPCTAFSNFWGTKKSKVSFFLFVQLFQAIQHLNLSLHFKRSNKRPWKYSQDQGCIDLEAKVKENVYFLWLFWGLQKAARKRCSWVPHITRILTAFSWQVLFVTKTKSNYAVIKLILLVLDGKIWTLIEM